MKRMLTGVTMTSAMLTYATDLVVQDHAAAVLTGARNNVTMISTVIDAFPSELGTPTFWFDASQTNNWVFWADGTVKKVPSLVGNRYLTSDVTEPGTSWSTWKSGRVDQTLKPPFLVSNVAALGGGNAIDFGPQQAGRGLLFNAVEQSDGSTKSHLENIGTVVAVYDSTEGGGYFLSGGKSNGMDWGRSYNYILSTKSVTDYCNLFVAHNLSPENAMGMYWQDDLFGAVHNGGLGGQWQVIAYNPLAVLPFSVGLGIGCTGEWYKEYSGGMKIAELLIFDTVIADDDLHKISIWLQKKWFGRSPAGYNFRACASQIRAYYVSPGAKSASVDLTVNAGDTLEIGRFVGGRAGAKAAPADLYKAGAGTLKVRDIRAYNGNVTLAGGTLGLAAKRTVPTAGNLPRGLFVRLDPSSVEDVETVTEGGKECVSAMASVNSLTYYGNRIWARPADPSATGNKPEFLRNALGTGLHTVDFGKPGSLADGGRCLLFATNRTLGANASLPAVCTLVAVVGAQQAGGHILDGMMFKRDYQWVRQNDGSHAYALLNPTAVWSGDSPKKVSPQKYGTIYIDGEKRAQNAGYPTPTYHVLAMQVPQCYVHAIGRYDSEWMGGFKMGEMLLFNRPLSEVELMDAQAYLAKKWFGRTLAGYDDGTTVPDVQNVVVAEPSAINVPTGEVVRIGKLTARAKLEKTGAGTLIVGAGSDTSGVVVREGAVKAETNPPDVTAKCELAKGDSFHLDATSTRCIDLMLGHESENRITCWNDEKYRNCAYQFALTQNEDVRKHPTLTTAAALNGKQVVDFGDYVPTTDEGVSCFLNMERPVDSVRSVYIVIGSAKNGGNPLGTYYRDNDPLSFWGLGDFARGTQKTITLMTPWFSSANENVKGGAIYIDGVQKTFATAFPNGGYQLVELHTAAGASFSEIGRSIYYYDMGGFTLGELVVYERPLSDREKVATRNYLLKKWFDKTEAELADLPAPTPAVPQVVERELTVNADVELAVAEPRTVKSLKGDGTLTKTASAALTLEDLSDFKGTLTVAEGQVKLSGRPLAVEPKMKAANRILHLDAAQGLSLTTNEDHTVSVNSWASLLGDGWTAVPGVSTGDKKTHKPTLMQNELNDLPVVSMKYHGWTAGEEYMLFQTNGIPAQLKNILGVFWVIGSQEGGGILLGGGQRASQSGGTTHRVWNRRNTGGSPGTIASQGLIDSSLALDDVYAWSDWYRNGEKLASPTSEGLTGGYDTLSMAFWPSPGTAGHRSWNKASADGLAFDGRELDGEDWRQCRGNQRLGEVIVYDTYLTTEEQLATEAYLSSKWGLSQKCHTNAATVVLAEGTRLVCENGNQFVGGVEGTGTVEGDVTIRRFVADGEAEGFTLNGTLTIPTAPVFEIRNVEYVGGNLFVPICSATACEGVESLRGATFVGVPEHARAKAWFSNGNLYVEFKPKGLTLIIR